MTAGGDDDSERRGLISGILHDQTSTREFASLDALRGYAVLGVVILHSANLHIFDYGRAINFFVANGQLGVQLFYLISAFSLCLSNESRGREPGHLKKYAVRRLARIAPLYYLVLAYYVLPRGAHVDVSRLLSVVTFTNGLFPEYCTGIADGSWSIAVEMVFYLLLPFILRFAASSRRLLILLVASILIARVVIHSPLSNAYYFIGYQLAVFVIGCLACRTWMTRGSDRPSWIALLLLWGLVWKWGLLHIWFSFVFAVVLVGTLERPVPILFGAFFRYLGKVSYGVYLLHFIVLRELDKWNPRFAELGSKPLTLLARVAVVLLLSMLAATISFVTVERPVTRYIRQWLRTWTRAIKLEVAVTEK